MLNASSGTGPEDWRALLDALLTPVSWIPTMQMWLFDFLFYSESGWAVVGKYVFLLFPLMLFLGAMWCTMGSVYTIPFRSNRIGFTSTMLLAWWDAARSVWLFWVGIGRFLLVAAGWVFNLARMAVRLLVEAFRHLVFTPFALTGKLSRSYFQPGIAWIAFVMLVGWCMLEATIFTYVMFPTIAEVLTDLVGVRAPVYTGPALYMFLLLLILGSFACVQAMLDTVKARNFKFIVQMIVIELFVMFFEVMFLYRELVDAVTPWIAQRTGEQLGAFSVLALATFGWIGIRGMTWFLFGRFGTPPLLAFISRKPLESASEAPAGQIPHETSPSWRGPINELKSEIEWLHRKSDELLEYVALPVLQLLAAMLNFAMIPLISQPVFDLPLKSLKDVMSTREVVDRIRTRSTTRTGAGEPKRAEL